MTTSNKESLNFYTMENKHNKKNNFENLKWQFLLVFMRTKPVNMFFFKINSINFVLFLFFV